MSLRNIVARWSAAALEWCADRMSVPISLKGMDFGEVDVVPALVASMPGSTPSDEAVPGAAIEGLSPVLAPAEPVVRSGEPAFPVVRTGASGHAGAPG